MPDFARLIFASWAEQVAARGMEDPGPVLRDPPLSLFVPQHGYEIQAD
jgi:hypothetical protein